MSLHNIKLTANYFAITHPEGVKNLNQYVFQKMLKKNKVDTFYSSTLLMVSIFPSEHSQKISSFQWPKKPMSWL